MTSKEIRQAFLDFFKDRGHEIVPSSPVVPHDDPTLMFTNAGMNQFKDVFLGSGTRSYVRAADTQKCIRAGGKHNDLDDVGQDTYHHTFFEMLGNWSFGDYFKKEAIEWAWELLTGVWGVEKDRLYATYFEGDASDGLEPDSEAATLWREVTDIDPSHIIPGDKKDNFWEMGDTGPCGPCSEIHIDLTPDKSGGPLVNQGDHRVMEIWNLVFIQFNRDAGGKLTPLPAKHVDTGMGFERICAVLQKKSSNYDTDVFTPIFKAIQSVTGAPDYRATLPSDPNRDRKEAVANPSTNRTTEESTKNDQGPPRIEQSRDRKEAVHSSGVQPLPYGRGSDQIDASRQQMIDVTYRVIADHIRTLTFALTDGAVPSNDGRGYVLRRILRRAVRYGWQYLDMHEPFLCKLVPDVVALMGEAFPELREARGGKNIEHITELIRDEEESFLRTFERGLLRFEIACADAIGRAIAKERGDRFLGLGSTGTLSLPVKLDPKSIVQTYYLPFARTNPIEIDRSDLFKLIEKIRTTPIISGKTAFKLHDTFGLYVDITSQMAKENGLDVDMGEFEYLMERARNSARAAQAEREDALAFLTGQVRGVTEFVGYNQNTTESSIITMFDDAMQTEINSISTDQSAWIVLDCTPLYPEQGGQIGDTGKVVGVNDTWEFQVEASVRKQAVIFHRGRCMKGTVFIDLPSAANTGGPANTPCRVFVNASRRWPTMQNHTATHVMNWALRDVLGDTVDQKGSLVDPEKTRFDFSHNKPVTDEQLARIERLVRDQIKQGLDVYAAMREDDFVDQEAARKINTLRAVFGEKYPDRVRVVSIGVPIEDLLAAPDNPEWMNYSVEFCGGTHVSNTREIEAFCLIGEEGVAKGVRRVVGVSGDAAKEAIRAGKELLAEAKALIAATDSGDDGLPARVSSFQTEFAEAQIPILVRREIAAILSDVQKALRAMEKEQAAQSGGAVMDVVAELFASAESVGGVTVVVGEVPTAPPDALRGAIDWIRNKTESSAVLLAMAAEGKVTLIAGMSKDAVKRGLKAGDLIKEVAPIVGGRGGGRPDMAQGGGTDPSKIGEAVDSARDWINGRLG